MILCEHFESQYRKWRKGSLTPTQNDEMRVHQSHCSTCASITDDMTGVREMLADLPRREPRAGFELRLQYRIKNGAATPAKEASGRSMPRWAALGAGLAFGLVVGLVTVVPLSEKGSLPMASIGRTSSTPAMKATVPGNVTAMVSATDTMPAAPDTALRSASGYDPDCFSHTVSGSEH